MATLLLTAVGTAVGGPLGGALGALVGQQVDGAVFGSGKTEGPRINDLAVTTSTYGQAVPRIFGRMRVPGSIIWATDLQESSETNGNGKGKPKTTTYAYSISFAVALSSRPIEKIGRIWADGNLLRGAGGDLKAGGQFRLHNGSGNQAPDPLLASALGANCPAFRDIAYVVFEDLQLADFGNRIPTLTFELEADQSHTVSLDSLVPFAASTAAPLPHMQGFADSGGAIRSTLNAINRVFPLSCVTASDGLKIARLGSAPADIPMLPLPIQAKNTGGGKRERSRSAANSPEPRALRYFDIERDYQASVQRTIGVASTGRELMLQLPATMAAAGARAICNQQTLRSRWQKERLTWHIAELDKMFSPGAIVQAPDLSGHWLVKSWEWMERGVELTLEKIPPEMTPQTHGAAGQVNSPLDELPSSSAFAAFELPWDGIGSSDAPLIFAAATGTGANWSGATFFVDRAEALVPANSNANVRATIGSLAQELAASQAVYFEAGASIDITLADAASNLNSTTIAEIASGANRMLIGEEVIQFLCAEALGANVWRLTGLLRGRGGTEFASFSPHPIGTTAVLIDDALVALDPNLLPTAGDTELAAIGLGDDQPVYTQISITGISRNPLAPVHTRVTIGNDGNWELCWTRRARGQWAWRDGIELPLIEENESYVIGYGPVDQPIATWSAAQPVITLDSNTIEDLIGEQSGGAFWVQQSGTYGLSPATFIAALNYANQEHL